MVDDLGRAARTAGQLGAQDVHAACSMRRTYEASLQPASRRRSPGVDVDAPEIGKAVGEHLVDAPRSAGIRSTAGWAYRSCVLGRLLVASLSALSVLGA
jgi:hypothetical protein